MFYQAVSEVSAVYLCVRSGRSLGSIQIEFVTNVIHMPLLRVLFVAIDIHGETVLIVCCRLC